MVKLSVAKLEQTRWPPPLAQTAHHMNCSRTTCAPQDRSSAGRVELAMPGAMSYSIESGESPNHDPSQLPGIKYPLRCGGSLSYRMPFQVFWVYRLLFADQILLMSQTCAVGPIGGKRIEVDSASDTTCRRWMHGNHAARSMGNLLLEMVSWLGIWDGAGLRR